MAVTATATFPGGRWAGAAATPSVPAAVGAAALFFWVFLLIDSTCGDARAASFAVVDVPFFNAPAAAPDEPDRVERSFVPSAAAGGAAGRATGADAFLPPAALLATGDLRAAAASIARDAGAVFAAAFFAAGAFAGVFATGCAFFAGAAFFAGTAFFATGLATGLVALATGLAGAFLAGAAFLVTGFAAGLAAFLGAGFAAVLRAGGAAFFAVFFVATSACPFFP